MLQQQIGATVEEYWVVSGVYIKPVVVPLNVCAFLGRVRWYAVFFRLHFPVDCGAKSLALSSVYMLPTNCVVKTRIRLTKINSQQALLPTNVDALVFVHFAHTQDWDKEQTVAPCGVRISPSARCFCFAAVKCYTIQQKKNGVLQGHKLRLLLAASVWRNADKPHTVVVWTDNLVQHVPLCFLN